MLMMMRDVGGLVVSVRRRLDSAICFSFLISMNNVKCYRLPYPSVREAPSLDWNCRSWCSRRLVKVPATPVCQLPSACWKTAEVEERKKVTGKEEKRAKRNRSREYLW